ncbi:MAG: hypothetical protein IT479_05385 [Xanthomonadales bacterium]|nr:hypothetical protein [Xanthomonadales bacterium]MCC6592690.1 hypothetical protein [Xanthomonadales bacterium]MCE7930815.1 hypothetical protein [Xanthomonadales bacterium PRO6]
MDKVPQSLESGPFLADRAGVYTRERGAERWLLVGACAITVALIALLPLSLQDRMHVSLALVVGCGIGSSVATWWRRRHPLPLVIEREGVLLCFAPRIVPKLLARFPVEAVASVALAPSAAGMQIEWLFRGGEQGRFTLCRDARIAQPLAFFLTHRFGARFKDRST